MTAPGSASTPFPSRIAVTGATGFLGGALTESLRARGATVLRLTRRPSRGDDVLFDPEGMRLDPGVLEGVDAVVSLAGESVAQRWTPEAKRRIHDSRVRGTDLLAKTIAQLERKPAVMLSGSAIGFYGDRGDEPLDENSAPGHDFLARLSLDWERVAEPVRDVGVRLVYLRTGIVLGAHGGMLAGVLPLFRNGLGGTLGSGRQWTSWIALQDWVRATELALTTPGMSGPVNLVGPAPATNEEFTKTLGFVLHRPTLLHVPAFALRLRFGEMADGAILASQRVLPRKLTDAGFTFRFPTLEGALEEAVRSS